MKTWKSLFQSAGPRSGSHESHLDFSFADHVLQSGVDERKASKSCLVHGVDEVLVCVGEPWLLAQELSVKVAAVTGGFLWVAGQG